MSKQEDRPRLTYEVSGVRQVRATALGRGTHGVPDVRRMVESQFHVAFPHRVWVAGQVGAPSDGPDGTLRFPLWPSTGDDPFRLPCVVPAESLSTLRSLLHRTHDADVEDVVRDGRLARVGGLLRYDAERNSVVFVVSELDPTPTARELDDARAEAVHAVREAGLAAHQRALGLGRAPLEVALVGAAGDAAVARVQGQLESSPYDVDVAVLPVVLTGPDAPALLAQAVRSAASRSDVVLMVRDEGRPLGLAAYDALEVAQAVADAPVPVLTGLGGAGIRTACDEVAFVSLPTAEAAAEQVLRRLSDAERALVRLTDDVTEAADEAAARCRTSLAEAEVDVLEAGEQAASASEQARRAARVRLLVACAVLAVVVVAAALGTGRPLLLLGLLVPLLLFAGVSLWWRSPTRGRRHMGQRDDDFTQVLVRLKAVREELSGTRSPERVAVLRDVAGELVAQGRELLGRHLDGPAASRGGGAGAGGAGGGVGGAGGVGSAEGVGGAGGAGGPGPQAVAAALDRSPAGEPSPASSPGLPQASGGGRAEPVRSGADDTASDDTASDDTASDDTALLETAPDATSHEAGRAGGEQRPASG